MKSQDIPLLLKIISLHIDLKGKDVDSDILNLKDNWSDWNESALRPSYSPDEAIQSRFSVRSLENDTGISKTQISLSLSRMYDVGLAKLDRRLRVPKVNTKSLLEFIAYGIMYVFPAKEGELARGIATSIASPVLKGKLMTSGELPPVWPNPEGNTKGLSIVPLHPHIFKGIKSDARLYAMLALVDAVRLGHARERNLAIEKLSLIFEGVK